MALFSDQYFSQLFAVPALKGPKTAGFVAVSSIWRGLRIEIILKKAIGSNLSVFLTAQETPMWTQLMAPRNW